MSESASPASAAARKTALRSSKGCSQCRRRKVKCDESRPECLKCIKHRVSCSFNAQNVIIPQPRHPIERLQELELLHHFSTSTYLTLTDRREVQNLMQFDVPTEALSHDFLLYCVFAVSAFHLAHLRPARGHFYTDLAVQCQNHALKSYMAIAPATNATNSGALLLFSSLVSVYSLALASSRPHGNPAEQAQDDLESATGWMRLTRGVGSVVVAAREHIRNTKFEILLHGHTGNIFYPLPEDCAAVLETLPTLWMTTDTTTNVEQRAYDGAFQSLKFVLGEIRHLESIEDCDLGMGLSWSGGRVTPDFVALCADRKPVALVLFAYYCVVLNAVKRFWCIGTLPRRLVVAVHSLLDDSYRAWIRWPMETIGVSPADL